MALSRKSLLEPLAHRIRRESRASRSVRDLRANLLGSPAQVRFENLADVHTRRNAERIQHDFHRRAVRHVRHVFFRNDARDHALVAVAAGHLVADGELALHGDIDFDQLDDAGRKFVALLQLLNALVGDLAQYVDLPRSHLLDLVDLFDEQRIFVAIRMRFRLRVVMLFEDVARELGALGEQPLVGLFVVQVGQELLAVQQSARRFRRSSVRMRISSARFFSSLNTCERFDGLVALVLFRALAAEDLDVDDGALDARRAVERSVANVAGLFAEDGAQAVSLPASAWFRPWA